MMRTRSQIAKTIDHAVLKPASTVDDLVSACHMCKAYDVACLCVRPTDVAVAAAELTGSEVVVAAVVGFPHGAHRTEVKALEAQLAIEDGATELDMVMNIGMFLSGDYDLVSRDIAAVVAVAKCRNVAVKVILETCYLSPEQIAQACLLARGAGADYVKTSTGFAEGAATPEAVAIMMKTVGDCMKVKASGGIRSLDALLGYLDQGCHRVGLSATKTILDSTP
jgi:deoxyribose-phosphate aldolase